MRFMSKFFVFVGILSAFSGCSSKNEETGMRGVKKLSEKKLKARLTEIEEKINQRKYLDDSDIDLLMYECKRTRDGCTVSKDEMKKYMKLLREAMGISDTPENQEKIADIRARADKISGKMGTPK